MIILVPFRKGSTRVKDKNMRLINGKPLVYYTIMPALETGLDVHMTTDYDYETDLKEHFAIKATGKMPPNLYYVRRPAEICTSSSPATEYISHFLSMHDEIKDVCLLQPTCPLRTIYDIKAAIEMYQGCNLPCLVSAYRDKQGRFYENFGFGYRSMTWDTRQDQTKPMFIRNSSIYIFNAEYFKIKGTIFDQSTLIYEMPFSRSLDINTEEEFNNCKAIIENTKLEV